MPLLSSLTTLPDTKRWWLAVGISCLSTALLVLIGIYGIAEYGVALFVVCPFYTGFSATALYAYKNAVTKPRSFTVALSALGILGLILLVFALEGIICIAMAAPIALALLFIGSSLAYFLVTKKGKSPQATVLLIFVAIPLLGFVEKEIDKNQERLIAVTSSVRIQASRENVWQHVIEFPELEAPQELLFKAGIAYPLNATIKGQGQGAIRYCNFTTGSFVEPITTWQAPILLAFDVLQSPMPMKELSFWDIDAPHLHDYFVSKKGQFKLIKVSDTETILEGTTWYSNKIKPNLYWNLWSDYIVHKIHHRVLNHIKKEAEDVALTDASLRLNAFTN